MTGRAMAISHEPGCTSRRAEDYELDGSRGGRAHISRCLDCGCSAVTWLVLPAPAEAPAEHQPHEDPRVERARNAQLQHHLQRQRFLFQS